MHIPHHWLVEKGDQTLGIEWQPVAFLGNRFPEVVDLDYARVDE
jgi:hypothetical protein